MTYYHNLITQQSWRELVKLKKQLKFVLIGGWAAYLYTKTLKSKDIDILVDYSQMPTLAKYYQLTKNERLKKYEAVTAQVQIDVYLPHFSHLGIPVETLLTQTRSMEGFIVLKPNYLLALKLYTLQQRGRTDKGYKDFVDVIALIRAKCILWDQVRAIIKTYHLDQSVSNFQQILAEHSQIPELTLNTHQFAQLKKQLKF